MYEIHTISFKCFKIKPAAVAGRLTMGVFMSMSMHCVSAWIVWRRDRM